MSAVTTKPRAARKAPDETAPASSPTSAEAIHPAIGISTEAVGPMIARLDQAVAALSMLCIHFSGDSGFDEPGKAGGLMGTLQFVQRTLSDCFGLLMEANNVPETLYWGAFLAHSLVTLLEEHQWADGYLWTMSEQILYGVLTAARDQADTALTFLVQAESQS